MLIGEGRKREERNGNMEHDGNECFSLFFFVTAFADGNDRSVKKAKLDGERKRDDLDLFFVVDGSLSVVAHILRCVVSFRRLEVGRVCERGKIRNDSTDS